MKRIIYIFISVAIVASCRVGDPEVETTSAEEIISYTMDKLNKCVCIPAEILSASIDLDSFLKLPDEERSVEKMNGRHVAYLGEDTYRITDEKRNMDFAVFTDGKSICTEGVKWKFSRIVVRYLSFDYYYNQHTVWGYSGFSYQEGGEIEATDMTDKTWTFMPKEDIEATLQQVPSDSLHCWLVKARCSDKGENRLSSVSVTSEEGMTVREVKDVFSQETEFVLSGKFCTDIYKGEDKIDYCVCQFRPGFSTSYTLSR